MFFFNRKKNKPIEENQHQEQPGEESIKKEITEEASEKAEEAAPSVKAEEEKQDSPAQKAESEKNQQHELSGFALFKDRNLDLEVIAKDMRERAGLMIEVQQDCEQPTFIVKSEEGTFVCTHLPVQVPKNEVQKAMPFNYIEKEAVKDIQEHQAFIAIARVNEPFHDRVHACITFTKIASVLMQQSNAAGMYIGAMHYILAPERYSSFLEQIIAAENSGEYFFPMPLWVKISMFKGQNGTKAMTLGLREFGLHEVGFYHTKREPQEIFRMIMGLCDMYLVERCQFEDGDSMRLDPQTKAVFKLENDILYITEQTGGAEMN